MTDFDYTALARAMTRAQEEQKAAQAAEAAEEDARQRVMFAFSGAAQRAAVTELRAAGASWQEVRTVMLAACAKARSGHVVFGEQR